MTQISQKVGISSRLIWILFFAGAIALSLHEAGVFRQDLVNAGGWTLLGRFFVASLQPELSLDFLRLTGRAALVTFAYAVCGTFLSVLLGIVGGIFASEIWWLSVLPRQLGRQPIWVGVRALLAFPRAIHELIWGLFFVNIFGLDPLVAILAIAIPYGAIVAKVFSEILDETPRQPLEALLNSGVSPLTAFLYGLVPQAFLNLLSYTFYRFECSIRSAAVLGIVGAGGLGYEILLSLQSLRYQQLWTFFYALFLLNGAVDFGSAWLRKQLGSPSRLDLNFKTSTFRQKLNLKRDFWLNLTGIGILILIPICFAYVDADFTKLWSPRTGELLQDIGARAFPLQLDRNQLGNLFQLSLQTVAMSLLAIAGAGFCGVLLSFPAAHRFILPGGVLHPGRHTLIQTGLAWATLFLSRAILLIARAIPAPIWALVFLFVLFPGILPGAIALGLHNLGILGRLMAEVVENLDPKPLEALKSQGAPNLLVFLYGVLPLTLPRFLAYILYRWEVCMRETVIVGLVGAGGLGRLLTEQLSSFNYSGVVVSLGCFMILTFLVDTVSTALRRSLRSS